MIIAWVLYYDYEQQDYFFESRESHALDEVDPAAWGLSPGRHKVILVLQNAQFVGAWLKGARVKGT